MNHPSKDVIYLLAYPRSGGNWFRYCFEFVTKKATGQMPKFTRKNGTTTSTKSPYLLWETLATGSQFLYHTHRPFDASWEQALDSGIPVKNILLLRNYKEAVISNLVNLGPDNPASELAFAFEHGAVMNELSAHYLVTSLYDKFLEHDHEGGLLIYYEDFIEDPASTLMKVIDYLEKNFDKTIILSSDEMKINLNTLLENFDHHRNISLNSYREDKTQINMALTSYDLNKKKEKSSDLLYYSSRLHKYNLLDMDKTIKELDIVLFYKYLSRYDSKDGLADVLGDLHE